MQRVRSFFPLNLRAVFIYLAALLRPFGVVLILPALVALFAGELLYVAIFAALALTCFFLGRNVDFKAIVLDFQEALVVTAAAYLLFAVIAALPFLPVTPFLDSFFESMSGITTTGLSVVDVERLPVSLLFFRAYLQWVGGAGIIIISLVMFLEPGKASFQLYASEFGRENLVGSIFATAGLVVRIYLTLTVIGFFVFLAVGMTPFDSLLHILSTVSTGGFSPYRDGMARFSEVGGGLARPAVIMFMVLGAITFPLYYTLFKGGWKPFSRDSQVRGLVFLIASTSLLFLFFSSSRLDFVSALFEAASTVTTTGFSVSDPAAWPETKKIFSAMMMMIGGSNGSSAGGIKIVRLLLLLKMVHWSIQRSMLPPEAKVVCKYGGQPVAQTVIIQTATLFFVYLFMLVFSMLVLSLYGFSVVDALFESASALGTVGLSAGITSAGLSSGCKVLLIFDMWAGRLEILPVLILFYPGTWLWKKG
ncbi:MAG: TrkH family potassium uptake protein [Desulfobulbaceae bacterium]|nr:TrkH family potassium uptake protein [Desulfobulbaceae bacterium]